MMEKHFFEFFMIEKTSFFMKKNVFLKEEYSGAYRPAETGCVLGPSAIHQLWS